MAKYSDLVSDYGRDIKNLCNQIPEAEIMETSEELCTKLSKLETWLDNKQ